MELKLADIIVPTKNSIVSSLKMHGLYDYQVRAMHGIIANDMFLLYHKPGLGKTRIMAAVSDYYKNQTSFDFIQGCSRINRVLYIVPPSILLAVQEIFLKTSTIDKNWITFIHPDAFFKKIENIADYSDLENTLIFFDEAHSYLVTENHFNQNLFPTIDLLKKIANSLNHVKMVFSSGTFMTNHASMTPWFNLLLPNNLNEEESFWQKKCIYDERIIGCKSKISFMPKKNEIERHEEIRQITMGKKQAAFYETIYQTIESKKIATLCSASQKLRQVQQILLTPELEQAVKNIKKGGKNGSNYFSTMKCYFQKMGRTQFSQYSAGWHEILNCIEESTTKKIFIYFDLVFKGATLFAAALEAFLGYTNSLFDESSHGKKYMYMPFDDHEYKEKFEACRLRFNSPDNCFGEFIQIVIITPRFSIGTEFKDVTLAFISPQWNDFTFQQVISRIDRLASFDNLLSKKKDVKLEIIILVMYIHGRPLTDSVDYHLLIHFMLEKRKNIQYVESFLNEFQSKNENLNDERIIANNYLYLKMDKLKMSLKNNANNESVHVSILMNETQLTFLEIFLGIRYLQEQNYIIENRWHSSIFFKMHDDFIFFSPFRFSFDLCYYTDKVFTCHETILQDDKIETIHTLPPFSDFGTKSKNIKIQMITAAIQSDDHQALYHYRYLVRKIAFPSEIKKGKKIRRFYEKDQWICRKEDIEEFDATKRQKLDRIFNCKKMKFSIYNNGEWNTIDPLWNQHCYQSFYRAGQEEKKKYGNLFVIKINQDYIVHFNGMERNIKTLSNEHLEQITRFIHIEKDWRKSILHYCLENEKIMEILW